MASTGKELSHGKKFGPVFTQEVAFRTRCEIDYTHPCHYVLCDTCRLLSIVKLEVNKMRK